jgi:exodeoxyribonuclease V alpha subunit
MLGLPVVDTTAGPDSDAASDLAMGFGSLLSQLHLSQNGAADDAEVIALIGQALSELASDGHACLPLKDAHRHLAGPGIEVAALVALLQQSPVIGTASPKQLAAPDASVIFDRDRLYLQRYWRYEARLAAQIGAIDTELPIGSGERLQQVLDQLFFDTGEIDWQKVAVATALLRRLCLVTGGPGTGKTHTIARMLMAHSILAPEQRVALAAPTGKAALRLEQLIGAQLSELERAGAAGNLGLLERLRRLKAQTVHRLLGVRSRIAQLRFDRDRPLPYDLVVIDEASMLDLSLASRLVDALPEHARLVLVGDADQLSSVETGTVFSELVSLAHRDRGFAAELSQVCGLSSHGIETSDSEPLAIGNAVVRLKHSFRYRAEGGIGMLAEAVRTGDVESAMAILEAGSAELRIEPVPQNLDPAALALRLFAAFEPLMRLIDEKAPIALVLKALTRTGVLCALRRGPLGALRLNMELARLAAVRQGANPQGSWFPGKAVMVTRNDPQLNLYNGDLGIALEDEAGLLVHFADGSLERAIAPGRLALAETAFAITVHKSQGSEFDHVDIILPQPNSPLASRELLYTALTRARHSVTLWGDPGTVAVAAARGTRRYSALAERLRAR